MNCCNLDELWQQQKVNNHTTMYCLCVCNDGALLKQALNQLFKKKELIKVEGSSNIVLARTGMQWLLGSRVWIFG